MKTILTLILLIANSYCLAQKLSLQEFIDLKDLDIDRVSAKLKSKGMELEDFKGNRYVRWSTKGRIEEISYSIYNNEIELIYVTTNDYFKKSFLEYALAHHLPADENALSPQLIGTEYNYKFCDKPTCTFSYSTEKGYRRFGIYSLVLRYIK